MNFFCVWHDDRCRGKVSLCTIFTQGRDFKVKITDLEFSYKYKSVSLPYDKDVLTSFTGNFYADSCRYKFGLAPSLLKYPTFEIRDAPLGLFVQFHAYWCSYMHEIYPAHKCQSANNCCILIFSSRITTLARKIFIVLTAFVFLWALEISYSAEHMDKFITSGTGLNP